MRVAHAAIPQTVGAGTGHRAPIYSSIFCIHSRYETEMFGNSVLDTCFRRIAAPGGFFVSYFPVNLRLSSLGARFFLRVEVSCAVCSSGIVRVASVGLCASCTSYTPLPEIRVRLYSLKYTSCCVRVLSVTELRHPTEALRARGGESRPRYLALASRHAVRVCRILLYCSTGMPASHRLCRGKYVAKRWHT